MRSPLRISVVFCTLSTLIGLTSCDDDSSPPVPSVLNINNSIDPASPVDLAIEINGDGFQGSPGEIVFSQGTNTVTVNPAADGWSDSGIVVSVPSSGSEGAFTVPGSLTVTVRTSGGTSNEVTLEVVTTPVFSVGDVEWATTTALPTALRGHQAVPVPNTSSSAYVVVAGGNDGSNNLATVLSNTLAADGQLGATWTTTTSLPASRAYYGMVSAHPGNSLIASGSCFIYVIAGQESAAGSTGGTNTVYRASVSLADGTVGAWAETSALPETLVGLAVTLHNNYIYVVGGLLADGTPNSGVYSAAVNSDGTLGGWTTSQDDYPVEISFATTFAFAGNLYVVGGDTASALDPNGQSEGTSDVRFAPVLNGIAGAWVSTAGMSKRRKGHVTWPAFGQVLAAEGAYQGSPGSLELERNVVASDGNLSPWNSITAASKQINANVYNAAGFVSPIRPASAGPRFLLLGGQEFSATPPGVLTSTVYYNTAP